MMVRLIVDLFLIVIAKLSLKGVAKRNLSAAKITVFLPLGKIFRNPSIKYEFWKLNF